MVFVCNSRGCVGPQTSDPEARGVAERAYKTLQRIGAEGKVTAPAMASVEVSTCGSSPPLLRAGSCCPRCCHCCRWLMLCWGAHMSRCLNVTVAATAIIAAVRAPLCWGSTELDVLSNGDTALIGNPVTRAVVCRPFTPVLVGGLQEVHTTLQEVVKADAPAVEVGLHHQAAMQYVSALATHLINVRDFEPHTWKDKVRVSPAPPATFRCTSYLAPHFCLPLLPALVTSHCPWCPCWLRSHASFVIPLSLCCSAAHTAADLGGGSAIQW